MIVRSGPPRTIPAATRPSISALTSVVTSATIRLRSIRAQIMLSIERVDHAATVVESRACVAFQGKPGQKSARAVASSTSIEQYLIASWVMPICWDEMNPPMSRLHGHRLIARIVVPATSCGTGIPGHLRHGRVDLREVAHARICSRRQVRGRRRRDRGRLHVHRVVESPRRSKVRKNSSSRAFLQRDDRAQLETATAALDGVVDVVHGRSRFDRPGLRRLHDRSSRCACPHRDVPVVTPRRRG